jgi:hypothetical protein
LIVDPILTDTKTLPATHSENPTAIQPPYPCRYDNFGLFLITDFFGNEPLPQPQRRSAAPSGGFLKRVPSFDAPLHCRSS